MSEASGKLAFIHSAIRSGLLAVTALLVTLPVTGVRISILGLESAFSVRFVIYKGACIVASVF